MPTSLRITGVVCLTATFLALIICGAYVVTASIPKQAPPVLHLHCTPDSLVTGPNVYFSCTTTEVHP